MQPCLALRIPPSHEMPPRHKRCHRSSGYCYDQKTAGGMMRRDECSLECSLFLIGFV